MRGISFLCIHDGKLYWTFHFHWNNLLTSNGKYNFLVKKIFRIFSNYILLVWFGHKYIFALRRPSLMHQHGLFVVCWSSEMCSSWWLEILPSGTRTCNVNQAVVTESTIRHELDKRDQSFISLMFVLNHKSSSSYLNK